MRPFLARFSEPVWSGHFASWADFITTTLELEFSVHTGDLRPEVYGTSHWWKNLGKETVILYVGDVRKDPNDHNM